MGNLEPSQPPEEHLPIVRPKDGDLAVRPRPHVAASTGPTLVVRVRPRGERRRDFRSRRRLRGMDELRRQQADGPPADGAPRSLDVLL